MLSPPPGDHFKKTLENDTDDFEDDDTYATYDDEEGDNADERSTGAVGGIPSYRKRCESGCSSI